ncbi:MAG: nuclear transport factor 2 family protein [Pseudomonadota bacterium]
MNKQTELVGTMTKETLKTVAETLVSYCREGKEAQGLEELYASDAVSMEAAPSPDGMGPESKGIDAIRGKHAWWEENFEVHDATVDGPFVHGDDRFAVIFALDATHKQSGKREAMREVAIYTLNAEGKIAREEFYYPS